MKHRCLPLGPGGYLGGAPDMLNCYKILQLLQFHGHYCQKSCDRCRMCIQAHTCQGRVQTSLASWQLLLKVAATKAWDLKLDVFLSPGLLTNRRSYWHLCGPFLVSIRPVQPRFNFEFWTLKYGIDRNHPVWVQSESRSAKIMVCGNPCQKDGMGVEMRVLVRILPFVFFPDRFRARPYPPKQNKRGLEICPWRTKCVGPFAGQKWCISKIPGTTLSGHHLSVGSPSVCSQGIPCQVLWSGMLEMGRCGHRQKTRICAQLSDYKSNSTSWLCCEYTQNVDDLTSAMRLSCCKAYVIQWSSQKSALQSTRPAQSLVFL